MASSTAQFDLVFKKLKSMLKPYEKGMTVLDSAQGYNLTAPAKAEAKEMFFGGVHPRKGYVSFYLMPVYIWPEFLETVSPELKKKMQGKSCFNFKSVDDPQLPELAKLVKKTYPKFRKQYL
jgi:hypothetical protein